VRSGIAAATIPDERSAGAGGCGGTARTRGDRRSPDRSGRCPRTLVDSARDAATVLGVAAVPRQHALQLALTTYWLSFNFRSTPPGAGLRPIVGSAFNGAMWASCQCFGASNVLKYLNDSLLTMASRMPHLAAATDSIRYEVFERRSLRPRGSTRLERQTISVVFGSGSIPLNAQTGGNCCFVETRPGGDDNAFQSARLYVVGAEYFCANDPIGLAADVYDHLNKFGFCDENAKTKEEISTAIRGSAHDNVSHVVEALVEAKVVERVKVSDSRKEAFRTKEPGCDNPIGQHVRGEIRNFLYGPVHEGTPLESRFVSGGYQIDFDVLFA